MMVRVQSAVVSGIEAFTVEVQVHLGEGKSNFHIIGLGDGAVREARERVQSALSHLGFKMPSVTLVNLAPAEVRKEGARFDLPIAIGILAAAGVIPLDKVTARSFLGELSLDGELKPVRGVLCCALGLRENGVAQLVVPHENYSEAVLAKGLEVTGAKSLREVVRWLRGGDAPSAKPHQEVSPLPERPSLVDVWGQAPAKRALIVAAAGNHNVLMVGPPGCGKSMLAERFASLLPPLDDAEQLEVARLHSTAGQPLAGILAGRRPFRAPHHVVSEIGLVGGGAVPRPGEISLAHRGVLFLDEFPEYRRGALEALRAPLESGTVTIARAAGSLTFPARFQLIAAMNPCPCGRLGAQSGTRKQTCLCSRGAIQAYLRKLSQPILDRIDIQVELNAVPLERMLEARTSPSGEDPMHAAQQVAQARTRQLSRQGTMNATLSAQQLRVRIPVGSEAVALLERASQRMGLTARGFVRVLRVAATIADLAECPTINGAHVAEALSFRALSSIERYVGAANQNATIAI